MSKYISPFSIKYWIKKGYSKKQAIYESKKRRASSIEYWLYKYPNNHKLAYKKFKNQHATNTLKSKIKKYGQKQGIKKYNICKKNLKKKLKNCKEYWLCRGYSLQDAKNKVSKIQLRDLNYFIKKYGKIIGKKKWKNKINKWQKTLNNKSQKEKDKINKSKGRHCPQNVYSAKNYYRKYGIKIAKSNFPAHKLAWYCIENFNNKKELYNYLSKHINKLQTIELKLFFSKFGFKDKADFLYKIFKKCKIKYLPNSCSNYFQAKRLYFNDHLCRSLGEFELAYFFKKYKIKYIYEKRYPRSKFKYDFYLIDYKIYIEYLGFQGHKEYDNKTKRKIKYCKKCKLKFIFSNNIDYIKNKVMYYAKNS